MVLDGPMTGAAFRAYIEQVLPDTGRHRGGRQPIGPQGGGRPREAAGASLLFLPPYSPADRTGLRQAQGALAQGRRTTDLWAAIAEAIDAFTPAECINFFAKAGYALD
jgi:hypothetical protein